MDQEPAETTIYSLSEATPAAPPERREGARILSLYRVGLVTIDGRRELCLIKNISAGGMMIRAYCSIPVGAKLLIELKSGYPLGCSVTWVRGHNLGVSFDEPIDVIKILGVSMDGPAPRMPRIAVATYVTVREGANIHNLRTCDICQGGVRVESPTPLPRDSAVVVMLPGFAPMPGVVRWTADGSAGISFNRLVPLPQLVSWLQERRGGVRSVR